MDKRVTLYIVAIFVVAMFAGGCLGDKQPKVCFDATCLKVEIAQTNAELERGLQYRQSMPRDEGMLFVFPQNVEAGFWMKNTLLPLDMIWINESQHVIHIEKNAPPCLQEKCPTYGPKDPIRYVLETNAGFADATNLQIGQEVKFFLVDKKAK